MEEVLSTQSLAIQAQWRTLIQIEKDAKLDESIKVEGKELLDKLSEFKSKLEQPPSPIEDAPQYNGRPFYLSKSSTLQLKSLLRQNTPKSLETFPNVTEMIVKELQTLLYPDKELVFACLGCCPWFSHTQDDRQSKARKNTIFFVFQLSNNIALGIRNQHANRRQELISVEGNEEWISGRELRSFIEQITKYHYKYIFALSSTNTVVYENEQWRDLCKTAQYGKLLYENKQFVKKATSQAIALVSVRDKKLKQRTKSQKKSPSGTPQSFSSEIHLLSMEARENISLFCECFKLLFSCFQIYVGAAVEDFVEWEPVKEDTEEGNRIINQFPHELFAEQISLPTTEAKIQFFNNAGKLIRFHLRKTSYQSAPESDELLLKIVVRLVHVLEKWFEKYPTPLPKFLPEAAVLTLENWLGEQRLAKLSASDFAITPVRINELQAQQNELSNLIDSIGYPLKSIPENQILFLVQGGSKMYNVTVATSDIDYICVYVANTRSLASSLQWPKESTDNRGNQFEVEHICYEVRLFCESLLKGNPSVIELLYTDQISYLTNAWQVLRDNRELFISEAVVHQYLSWIEFHLKLVKSNRNPDKNTKYLYHAFHKLYELERLINKLPVSVTLSPEEREFIMQVRTASPDGEFSRENLIAKVEERFQALKYQTAARTWRYRENGDWQFLEKWILTLRSRNS